jgi:hypothetical protein
MHYFPTASGAHSVFLGDFMASAAQAMAAHHANLPPGGQPPACVPTADPLPEPVRAEPEGDRRGDSNRIDEVPPGTAATAPA